MSEKLQLNQLYPLADRPPAPYLRSQVRALWTGEKRPPRKGEWYLSGAIIAAYQAPNDLTLNHCIAKIVRARKVVTWELIP